MKYPSMKSLFERKINESTGSEPDLSFVKNGPFSMKNKLPPVFIENVKDYSGIEYAIYKTAWNEHPWGPADKYNKVEAIQHALINSAKNGIAKGQNVAVYSQKNLPLDGGDEKSIIRKLKNTIATGHPDKETITPDELTAQIKSRMKFNAMTRKNRPPKEWDEF